MATWDDGHMTELAGHPELPPMKHAVKYERSTYASPQRHTDDVRFTLRRTESTFGPGGGVGVVIDDNRKADTPHKRIP
jgi:hypothetical protein